MAGGYQSQPDDESSLPAQLLALTRRLDAVERGLKSVGLHIDGATGNLIIDANAIIAPDPTTGAQVFKVGQQGFNDGSGRLQTAIVLRRADDGSTALSIGDFGTTPGHQFRQAVQWWDRSGHVVVADDDGGNGMARPHLSLGTLVATDISKWPGGAATVFTTIASANVERQHPRISWIITLFAAASTTTQFRLLVNGEQVGSTQTVTNGFATFSDTQDWPADIAFGQITLVELQCRNTSGSGAAAAQCLMLAGTQV